MPVQNNNNKKIDSERENWKLVKIKVKEAPFGRILVVTVTLTSKGCDILEKIQ